MQTFCITLCGHLHPFLLTPLPHARFTTLLHMGMICSMNLISVFPSAPYILLYILVPQWHNEECKRWSVTTAIKVYTLQINMVLEDLNILFLLEADVSIQLQTSYIFTRECVSILWFDLLGKIKELGSYCKSFINLKRWKVMTNWPFF